MGTEAPKEIIVDRAVELWKRMLSNPKYQVVAPGERLCEDDYSELLATTLPYMLPKNNSSEVLDKFGAQLKRLLMEGEDNQTYRWYEGTLNVDYNPCKILAKAAELSGLDMKFPYKTNMHLNDDSVSLSYGYAAPWEYHYPTPDGRWLITKLYGEDINKVIDYVMGNKVAFIVDSE